MEHGHDLFFRGSLFHRSCTTMATSVSPSPSWPWKRTRPSARMISHADRCLYDAIAGAVSEYSHDNTSPATERHSNTALDRYSHHAFGCSGPGEWESEGALGPRSFITSWPYARLSLTGPRQRSIAKQNVPAAAAYAPRGPPRYRVRSLFLPRPTSLRLSPIQSEGRLHPADERAYAARRARWSYRRRPGRPECAPRSVTQSIATGCSRGVHCAERTL